MGTISQKLEYLGETKTQLKDTINLTGANITNDTFRSYPSKLYKKLLDSIVDSEELYENLPKVNGTGTDITLNNTDECKIKFNMLGGNTTQGENPSPSNPQEIKNAGFESYNLVDFNKVTRASNTIYGNYSFKNNILNIKTIPLTYSWTGYDITDLIKNNPGKTIRFCYTDIDVSNNPTSNNSNIVVIYYTYNDGTSSLTQGLLTKGLAKNNRTIASDTSNISTVYLRIFTNNTNTSQEGSITIKEPMLIFGTADKPYQPYGYFANVRVHSKNLFNPTIPYSDYNGVDATIDNQQITFDGTSTAGGTKKMVNTPIPAGTYKLSFKVISGTHTANKKIYLDFFNASGTKIANPYFIEDGNQTLTLSSEATEIRLGFQIEDTFDNYTFVVQIEEGETATEYQQYYPTQTKLIDLNIYDNVGNVIGHRDFAKIGDYRNYFKKSSDKNLYGGFTFSKTNNGITFTYNTDGTISASGTSTGNALSMFSTDAINNGFLITLQAGTYTISGSNSNVSIEVVNNTGGVIATSVSSGASTFTINSATQVFIRLNIQSGKTINETIYQMLEKSSTPTTYEPYGTSWYMCRKVKKIVLDGSENWLLRSDVTQASGFYTFRNDDYVAGEFNTNSNGYSSYFVVLTSSSTTTNHIRFINSTGYGTQICIDGSIAQTSQALKTWLSTHPTEVQYILATPTYEVITNENVINSLESIVKSYEDETHIISIDDVPMYLDVSAVKEYE